MKHYNFLFLMADQIRTATLEGMGDGIQTPNLRRLMDESVLFTRASCTSRSARPAGHHWQRGVIPAAAACPSMMRCCRRSSLLSIRPCGTAATVLALWARLTCISAIHTAA